MSEEPAPEVSTEAAPPVVEPAAAEPAPAAAEPGDALTPGSIVEFDKQFDEKNVTGGITGPPRDAQQQRPQGICFDAQRGNCTLSALHLQPLLRFEFCCRSKAA
eukprot:gene2971-14882_t